MQERRQHPTLNEEQIEEIAERAAEKAVAKIHAKFYQEVGKGVVSKFLTIVGLVVVGAYMWMSSHGWVK
jgi:type IV secretory pathway VirB2 component (pilin)